MNAEFLAAPAPPSFVVGAPRSGTTLIQHMLRSHPALSIPTGESHFFIPLMQGEACYGSAEFLETDLHGIRLDVEAFTAQLVAQGRRTMRDLISGLFEANAAGEGKPRWGDKTPYYVLHMPALVRWWPEAKFIHIVRDGRDVALSLFARRHDFAVYNTYFAARYWEQYVETGRTDGSNLPSGQYLELRYEDLLTDQRGAMEAVCSFLDIAFDEALMDFKKSGEAGKTPLLQQPVQTSNAEKWRTAMSPAQIAAFEGGAATSLQRFGYPLATSGARLPLLQRAASRWHNAAVAHYYRRFPPQAA